MSFIPGTLYFTGINTQTTDYTLSLSDQLYYIRMDNTSPLTLTVPNNSTVAFPILTHIIVEQSGTGLLTILADSGVTITSYSTLKSAGQYAVMSLKKNDTNSWILSGNIQ